MEEKESQNEQYLRILTSGLDGKKDYESAKYLIDKKYAEGRYNTSEDSDTYGKVTDTYIATISSSGLDLINELRTKKIIEKVGDKIVTKEKNKGKVTKKTDKWYKKPVGFVFLSVTAIVIGHFSIEWVNHLFNLD